MDKGVRWPSLRAIASTTPSTVGDSGSAVGRDTLGCRRVAAAVLDGRVAAEILGAAAGVSLEVMG